MAGAAIATSYKWRQPLCALMGLIVYYNLMCTYVSYSLNWCADTAIRRNSGIKNKKLRFSFCSVLNLH